VTKLKSKKKAEESVDQYIFDKETRKNNPPVGLVTPGTDPDQPSKKYQYDPHLDPQLQWSGKEENSEFEVDTVSLHVHERIDPLTIIEKAMKQKPTEQQTMFHYFESTENNPPLRDAIEFYKHDQNWSNRLVAGDSLLVMNSLLEKEGMDGKIQMMYFDPPYGIKYGSNFQPFVNKRDVKDGKDEDLTQEPETIKAFRDTWELGVHSYLTYLQKRLVLAKRLLHKTGSIFVQISDENVHHVREILDEVFGAENFISQISFKKTVYQETTYLANVYDIILWYGKDKKNTKVRKLFQKRDVDASKKSFDLIENTDGSIDRTSKISKIPEDSKLFRASDLTSKGVSNTSSGPYKFEGTTYNPKVGNHWKTNTEGLDLLAKECRLIGIGKTLCFKKYLNDFPVTPFVNVWSDTIQSTFATENIFVVQTYSKVIQRCMLMTTDPGDLVFDPTCGSGTTAYVAEKEGRRWITCDSSRISIALTKQRIMTKTFDYYELQFPEEGINSNFKYEEVPHITLKAITTGSSTKTEKLFDHPIIDKSKIRISGPFTVEAVPSPTVKSMDVLSEPNSQSESSNKEISHQEQWREELLKTGIRGKSGQKIEFNRVESHPATKWLHADAETNEKIQKRVMISFGPQHAPLEQRQVALAIEEAQSIIPKPKMIIFAAMQFDPEAAKDIDGLNWPDVVILKVEMNKDLLTGDLKKKRSSNESFWLMGQPDIDLQKTKDKKYIITVNGFDYYNTKTGEIESGDASKITMWILDTDYDGRSVYPQQIFFPMDGKSGGWNKLAKTLQSHIDEELVTKYQGIESIPFESGFNKRVAVKIIDDRGIESLKIIKLE
jgi:adenine-specific DNA-methyltransferase